MQPETPITEHVLARDYLFHFLTFSLRSMQESASDTTVSGLERDDISEVTVPLAPLEEELRIVERIRELFARANEAELSVNAALKNAEPLEQSILERVFRGELVPQDPNDEPASVLLERIRAQRGTRGRKTARRKLGAFASPAAVTPNCRCEGS
jgi:type I restriction enzyme, S subunit